MSVITHQPQSTLLLGTLEFLHPADIKIGGGEMYLNTASPDAAGYGPSQDASQDFQRTYSRRYADVECDTHRYRLFISPDHLAKYCLGDTLRFNLELENGPFEASFNEDGSARVSRLPTQQPFDLINSTTETVGYNDLSEYFPGGRAVSRVPDPGESSNTYGFQTFLETRKGQQEEVARPEFDTEPYTSQGWKILPGEGQVVNMSRCLLEVPHSLYRWTSERSMDSARSLGTTESSKPWIEEHDVLSCDLIPRPSVVQLVAEWAYNNRPIYLGA